MDYQAPQWAEVMLHVLLKSQGLCNIKPFAKMIEIDSKKNV